MERRKDICGITGKIHYDGEIEELNLELVRVGTKKDGYFAIEFQDWTDDDEPIAKTLIRLHIKEAIELKAKIDQLVYDATLLKY
jgi:hypothetical protein